MLSVRTRTMTPRLRRLPQGFTLIEVLISLLVFSFGLLGAAALQALAVQAATQNSDRSRAALLANEMVTMLWANQSATPADADLAAWKIKVSTPAVSGLPNGAGTVTACSGVANCAVIAVTWKAPSAKAAASSNGFSTTVVIQ